MIYTVDNVVVEGINLCIVRFLLKCRGGLLILFLFFDRFGEGQEG